MGNMEDLGRAITVAEQQVKLMHDGVELALKTCGVDQFQMIVKDDLPELVGMAEEKRDEMEDDVEVEVPGDTGGALAPVVRAEDWGVADLIASMRNEAEDL